MKKQRKIYKNFRLLYQRETDITGFTRLEENEVLRSTYEIPVTAKEIIRDITAIRNMRFWLACVRNIESNTELTYYAPENGHSCFKLVIW